MKKKQLSDEEKERLKQEKKEKELQEKKDEKQRDEIYNKMVKYEKAHKKEPKIAPEGSYISLCHINKIYSNRVQAVYDFNLSINKNDFVVFVGPSGCGKSTTLRMIAGLEDITSGDLYIDGVYANDLEPKDRDISMVFQSYALYPHMTVYNNMAFGLKMRHVPAEEIDERVHKAAKILELENYLDRKPRALSGGQCQRVALGRAIVRNSKVFLMDEPLSNLDAKLRVQMRSEIVKLHEELNATTIYVTHDQTEAMTMATKIVVLKDGYIQQIGEPKEIYNKPSNVFVATFIGSPAMNILNAHYKDEKLYLQNDYCIDISDKMNDIKHFYENEIRLLKEKNEQLNKEKLERVEEVLFKNKEYKDAKLELDLNLDEKELILNQSDKEKTLALIEEAKKKLESEQRGLEFDLKIKPNSFYERRVIKKQIKSRNNNIEFYKNKINEFENDLNNLGSQEYIQEKQRRIQELDERDEQLVAILDKFDKNQVIQEHPEILEDIDKSIDENNNKIIDLEKRIQAQEGDIFFGIRPEDIGQEGFHNNIEKESEYFSEEVKIAELLGNEYYIHTLIGEDNLIAKVNAHQDIKNKDIVRLSFDLDKFHLFDKETKKLIW